MSMRRVRRPVWGAAKTVIGRVADATNPVRRSKILVLAAFAASLAIAALVVAAALPMISQADVAPVQVNSTLKCYDREGKHQPCLALAGTSQPRSIRRTAAEPASWTITALYQADDHPGNWTTSAPTARRSTPARRRGLAGCGRRLIPCFFSAVERGFMHIASVAANAGQARPAREHL